MGSKPSSNTSTTTKPPEYLRPYLEEAAASAQNLYQGGGTPLYTGPTIAGRTPAQEAAQASILQRAGVAPPTTNVANLDPIEQIYRQELGRESDAGGKAFWQRAFDEGRSIQDIRSDIRKSDEFKQRQAAGLGQVQQSPIVVPQGAGKDTITYIPPSDPTQTPAWLQQATQTAAPATAQAPTSQAPAQTQAPAQAAVDPLTAIPQQAPQTYLDILNRPGQVATDPIIRDAADASVQDVYRRLEEQTLPGISRGATGAGQLGSSRQGIAEGLATGRAAQTAQETRADLYARYLGEAQRTQAQALGMGGQMANLSMLPEQLTAKIGAEQQAYNQRILDANRSQFMQQAGQPQNNLTQYLQNLTGQTQIAGAGGQMGRGPGGQSTAGRLAGAGMAGLGTYGMMMLNPATAPFALAGGLLAGGSSFL